MEHRTLITAAGFIAPVAAAMLAVYLAQAWDRAKKSRQSHT
jgi:hypothetical protein